MGQYNNIALKKDIIMINFDFSPLYRSSVGFDHLASLVDVATQYDRGQSSYPPYNIELLDEDKYCITMAIAGFNLSELTIQAENNTLTVSGKKQQPKEKQYLHHGIAERNFEQRFQLVDHVKVTHANMTNGLLNIELIREIPEAMKPRRIEIQSSEPALGNAE
mgnify:CR=1 FL=1|jgi:molecular chaperone IbpA